MAKRIGGVAGIWLDDHELVKAAAKVRDGGFQKWDAITPFPVHGLERAMGLPRSWIPYVSFGAGLTGGCLAMGLLFWTSAISWAANVGGKPFFSGPAFVPITFELTVLFTALFSVGTLFAVCGLPTFDPPIIDKDLTSHKFAIFIPENDVGYDRSRVEQMLTNLGATEVRYIPEY